LNPEIFFTKVLFKINKTTRNTEDIKSRKKYLFKTKETKKKILSKKEQNMKKIRFIVVLNHRTKKRKTI
jgi:hypothetical protein